MDEHLQHFQESDLFEKKEDDDPKQTPQIGKIQTKDLFSSSTNEDKGFVFIIKMIHSVTFSRCKVLQAFSSTKKDENTKPFPRLRRNTKTTGTVDCLNYMLTSRRKRWFMIILPENIINK